MTIKLLLGSALLLATVVIAAMGSNSALDSFDIATDGAFTIQQRKENAARNQRAWDQRRIDR